MSDKKCEELIDDRLDGRLEDLLPNWEDAKVVDAIVDELGAGDDVDSYELRLSYRDRLLESVLSVDVRKSYRVLLSWGGPSDGFDFVFDKDGDLVECYYFYQDWFDGAKRPVDMEKAQELVHLYCVGPEFE